MRLRGMEKLIKKVKKIESDIKDTKFKPPKSLNATLRDYQSEGISTRDILNDF
jgi:hypothetical protein